VSLNASATVKVGVLRSRHPSYNEKRLQDLWALYEGGELFDAKRFIIQRRSEPVELYEERVKRAFYLGYIGEIVDFFVSALFQSEAKFQIADREGLPDWWQRFSQNCDRAGTDYNAFLRDRWTRALAQGRMLTWAELPEVRDEVLEALGETPTLKALDDQGARDAYLVPVENHELSDWGIDDAGNFAWATIEQAKIVRPSPFSKDRERVFRWTVMDREQVAVYTIKQELEYHSESGAWRPKESEKDLEQRDATLVRGKPFPHPFERVPLVGHTLKPALRVGPKLMGPQKAVVELDNGITWQQLMGLFAMPVVKSDRPFAQMMGEAYFIQLQQGDEFGWSEPAGTSIKTSMERRADIVEEMFRISHQMAQAVGSDATAAGQSAESKRRDMTPTQTVLEHLGANARDYSNEILRMVACGRQEKELVERLTTSGFDEFDVEELDTFLNNYLLGNAAAVRSETFQKLREKQFVDRTMPDLSPEDRKKIHDEIDTAPAPEDEDPNAMPGGGGTKPKPGPGQPRKDPKKAA
jgi:hypothetical protein